MKKIIGMNGGNTPPPQKPKIDLKDAKEIGCQNCGGSVFIPGTKFLKISKMITGTQKMQSYQIELYLCGDCGEINKELLPDELKPVITDLDG